MVNKTTAVQKRNSDATDELYIQVACCADVRDNCLGFVLQGERDEQKAYELELFALRRDGSATKIHATTFAASEAKADNYRDAQSAIRVFAGAEARAYNPAGQSIQGPFGRALETAVSSHFTDGAY